VYFKIFGACWFLKELDHFDKRSSKFHFYLNLLDKRATPNSNILRHQLVVVKAADLVLSVYKRYHHYLPLGCTEVHFFESIRIYPAVAVGVGFLQAGKKLMAKNEDARARDAAREGAVLSCGNIVRLFYLLLLLMEF
jgi:hypothetical protein